MLMHYCFVLELYSYKDVIEAENNWDKEGYLYKLTYKSLCLSLILPVSIRLSLSLQIKTSAKLITQNAQTVVPE